MCPKSFVTATFVEIRANEIHIWNLGCWRCRRKLNWPLLCLHWCFDIKLPLLLLLIFGYEYIYLVLSCYYFSCNVIVISYSNIGVINLRSKRKKMVLSISFFLYILRILLRNAGEIKKKRLSSWNEAKCKEDPIYFK